MVFDEVDLKVLRVFYQSAISGRNFSTWTIMKKIYPKGRDKEHLRVKRRMNKFVEMGLVHKNEEGFVLIKDLIKIDEIPAIKKCISLKVEGKWEIFET